MALIKKQSYTYATTTATDYEVIADAFTAEPYRLSKKERKLMNDEKKTQKWKNKMRKFDKK